MTSSLTHKPGFFRLTFFTFGAVYLPKRMLVADSSRRREPTRSLFLRDSCPCRPANLVHLVGFSAAVSGINDPPGDGYEIQSARLIYTTILATLDRERNIEEKDGVER